MGICARTFAFDSLLDVVLRILRPDRPVRPEPFQSPGPAAVYGDHCGLHFASRLRPGLVVLRPGLG